MSGGDCRCYEDDPALLHEKAGSFALQRRQRVGDHFLIGHGRASQKTAQRFTVIKQRAFGGTRIGVSQHIGQTIR